MAGVTSELLKTGLKKFTAEEGVEEAYKRYGKAAAKVSENPNAPNIYQMKEAEKNITALNTPGIDTAAHSRKSFQDFGAILDMPPLTKAAHWFRGGRGYLLVDDIADPLTDKEFLEFAQEGRALTKQMGTEKGLTNKQEERLEDIEETLGEWVRTSDVNRRLEASKMTLQRPLYVTRSGDPNRSRNHNFSAMVINPGRPQKSLEYDNTEIFKLEPGAIIYHPKDLADENEVVISGVELNRAKKSSYEDYEAAIKKGVVPFSVAGATVGLTQSEEAEADGSKQSILIASSLDKGAQPGELAQFLIDEQGMSQSDAEAAIAKAIHTKLKSSLDKGAPQEELLDYVAETKGYDRDYLASVLQPKEPISVEADPNSIYNIDPNAPNADSRMEHQTTFSTGEKPLSIEERVAKVENIHAKYSTIGKMAKGYFLGDKQAREEAKQESQELSTFIVENLKSAGIDAVVDPKYGRILITDAQGNQKPYDSSLWESLVASRSEFGYGATAAIAGEQAILQGLKSAGAAAIPHPGVRAVAFVGGAITGAAGAVFGRRQDILRNALDTKEKIDSKLMWSQLKDAGAADIVFSIAGLGIIKAGAMTARGVYRAYDLLVQGNREGAYTALKEFMHLDDTQVDEIIKDWENLSDTAALGLTRATRALNIIPRVTPGGEAIVAPAASLSPGASTNIANEIHKRAQGLLDLADSSTSTTTSSIVRDELTTYKDTVKQVYTGVKEFAISEMQDSNYTFDYSKLAIDPILKRTQSELTNPALRERAFNYLQRIRQLGGVTTEEGVEPTLRSFEDLLELRRVLNEFGSSRLVKNAKDIDLLVTIRSKIDGEITRAAKDHMEQPEEWLKLWKTARTEYGKMFQLEGNVLYKQIMRKGSPDKAVVNALMNRALATDNTFREVIEKLPPKIRALTENAVLDGYINKFTVGEVGGMRATHFPQLAKQLDAVPFTTKKAQDLKRAVTSMANVFKNDVSLAQVTGTVHVPGFQSYLTTDPVVRAQFMIASSVFNHARRLAPTKTGNAVALITHAANVLENPRNVKTFKALMAALPDDPTLKNTLKAAQLELAKFGEKSQYPQVEVYRRAPIGKTLTASDGPLGNGIYYSTSKGDTGSSGKLSSRKVLPDRIANEDNIKELLGDQLQGTLTAKIIKETPGLQELLQDKGYTGLAFKTHVLLFK